MAEQRDAADRVRQWLAEGQAGRIAESFSLLHPSEAAEVLHDLPAELRDDALKALPPKQAADVLEQMWEEVAAETVMGMAPAEAAAIVQEMETDEEVDLLSAELVPVALALDQVDGAHSVNPSSVP